jgi:hypothetical protein
LPLLRNRILGLELRGPGERAGARCKSDDGHNPIHDIKRTQDLAPQKNRPFTHIPAIPARIKSTATVSQT